MLEALAGLVALGAVVWAWRPLWGPAPADHALEAWLREESSLQPVSGAPGEVLSYRGCLIPGPAGYIEEDAPLPDPRPFRVVVKMGRRYRAYEDGVLVECGSRAEWVGYAEEQWISEGVARITGG